MWALLLLKLKSVWGSRLGKELILGTVVLVVLAVCFKLWLNKHDAVVRQEGRVEATEIVEKKFAEERVALQKVIDKDREDLSAAIASQKKEHDAIVALRASVIAESEKERATIREQLEKDRAPILTLTGTDIDAHIREQLLANQKAGATPLKR